MKAAVIYCSKSGNTKKIAQAIAEVLETEAKSVEEKIELRECDLICVGTGVHGFKPERGMTNFLKGLERLEGKKGAVVETYSSIPSGFLNTMESILREKDVDVIGKWSYKGKFLVVNRGRPNKKDPEDARAFAKTLKSKLAKGK